MSSGGHHGRSRSASISLGGTISTTEFAELFEHVAAEGLSTEWDGAPFQAADIIPKQPLHLCAHEVRWGCFEELERWCVAHGVPFSRRSDAYGCEWGAERVVFTGNGEPETFPSDVDGHVVIDRDTVVRLGSIEAVRGYFDAADFVVPPLVVADQTP